jgi:FXSXX-COOH protein
MNVIDDCDSKIKSKQTDLRMVPLATLSASSDVAMGDAVSRVLPAESKSWLPVAAFNSAI